MEKLEDVSSEAPLVTFYRMVAEGNHPMRAERSALGVLPTAAFQYCEAISIASAFGWYVFPPIDFHVQWDGTDLIWTHDGGATWSPVTKVHFPGFPDVFDEKAPEDIRGYAPPFLSTVLNGLAPGILQIWTGYMVRTRPDWSLLVRPPANLPRSQGYEPYEGIMETDRWFYPLFSNLRITATDRPIFFDSNKPLLQVQPLRRETYREADLRTAAFKQGLDDFGEADWADYRKSVVDRTRAEVRPGRYASAVRKRAHSDKRDDPNDG
jgi:hypothetical protein